MSLGFDVKHHWLAACAAVAASLTITAPSKAAVFYTVFTGAVAAGQDNAGDFGAVGELSGAFTAVYKVSTAGSDHVAGPYEELYRGAPVGVSGWCTFGSPCRNPVVEASLTINGHTVIMPLPDLSYGTVAASNVPAELGGGRPSIGSVYATGAPGQVNALLNLIAYTFDAPNRLVPYSGAEGGDYTPLGLAYWIDLVGGVEATRFTADLAVERVYVTDDLNTAVPEPASWALMILGLGGVGVALRRRQALAHA